MVSMVLLLASLAADGELSADVYRISGAPVSGVVTRLDAQGVLLQGGDGKLIPAAEITRIEFSVDVSETDRGMRKQPDAWLSCADGSRTPVSEVEVDAGKLTAKLLDGTTLKTPVKSVDAIRFYAPAPGTNRQWESLLKRPRSGDIVIVRKSAESLDLLEGVIHSVNADVVEFEFDGQKIPVRRTKLEGVAFLGQRERPRKPVAKLVDRYGGEWQLAAFTVESNRAQLETAGGIRWQWSIPNLKRLELASTNVIYLSDLEPERVVWEPYFPSGRLEDSVRRLFEPQRDISLSGGPLELVMQDGRRRTFAKGLSIHSRTELVYRLPELFDRFHATAGIDAATRGIGQVELTIEGDGKSLWSAVVTGSGPPTEIDLPLKGVRRLTVRVDYGDDLDIGDHLDLCDAKLIKSP